MEFDLIKSFTHKVANRFVRSLAEVKSSQGVELLLDSAEKGPGGHRFRSPESALFCSPIIYRYKPIDLETGDEPLQVRR